MNDVHKWSERDVVIDIVDVTSRQVVRLEKSFIAPIEFILDWRIYIYIYISNGHYGAPPATCTASSAIARITNKLIV